VWADPNIDLNSFYDVSGGSPAFGRYVTGPSGGTCSNWTPAGASGTMIQANGSATSGAACNVGRRIACCK